MKNFEKYKTAEERHEAFSEFCDSYQFCTACPLEGHDRDNCNRFKWLELEAENEKPMDCPFCGEECVCSGGYVECLNDNCCYSSGNRKRSDSEAIANHNSMCKAVAEYNQKGV